MIDDFARAQPANPMPRKLSNGRSIYESHNDFGDIRGFYILPKIAEFGLEQQRVNHLPMSHPIQPDYYRAPEVILGAVGHIAQIFGF